MSQTPSTTQTPSPSSSERSIIPDGASLTVVCLFLCGHLTKGGLSSFQEGQSTLKVHPQRWQWRVQHQPTNPPRRRRFSDLMTIYLLMITTSGSFIHVCVIIRCLVPRQCRHPQRKGGHHKQVLLGLHREVAKGTLASLCPLGRRWQVQDVLRHGSRHGHGHELPIGLLWVSVCPEGGSIRLGS